MNAATKLDIAIKAVCNPGAVDGVRKANGEWVIDWSVSATDADKAAGAARLLTFNPDAPTADEVRAECSRRVYEVCSQHTQMNLIAARAAGLLDASQQAVYVSGLNWINAMRAKCADLIAGESADYLENVNWPVCPPAFVALAKAF